MAWKFRPKRQDQCLPEGEYDAEVFKITKTKSKRGRDMVVVELLVHYGDRRSKVKDWIVSGFTVWKVEQIARGLGRHADFLSGTFRLGTIGGSAVRVRIKVEHDKTYGWQNRVDRYMETGLGMGPDVVPENYHNNFQNFSRTPC